MRIPWNTRNGFLLGSVDWLGHAWCHYCAIWSWVPLFHRYRPGPTPGTFLLIQNNIRHDVCLYLLRPFLLGYAALFYLSTNSIQHAVGLWFFAFATWSAIDLFVSNLTGTLFGYKNRPGHAEEMSLHRAQRRLLILLIDFVQVVFCYTIILWFSQPLFQCKFDKILEEPSHAFQLAFSTVTTIGYGTFAPMSRGAIIICLIESATGLLMISGGIAQMAALLKTPRLAAGAAAELPQDEGKEVTGTEASLRHFLPPLMTVGCIALLYWMAHTFRGHT
jgi:hypothetical protein